MPKVPPVGRRFQKGKTGNPRGSSAKARVLCEMGKLTAQQVHEVAAIILHGTPDDLKAMSKDPKVSVLKMWTAALVTKSIQRGDSQTYKVLMERLLGKPKESITLTGDGTAPIVTRNESKEEKLERLERLRKAREAVSNGK